MCVAGDGGDALDAEVERFGGVACALEEGHQEGTETTVDVERNVSAECEARETRDVVDDAVREVGGAADEEDSVAV